MSILGRLLTVDSEESLTPIPLSADVEQLNLVLQTFHALMFFSEKFILEFHMNKFMEYLRYV